MENLYEIKKVLNKVLNYEIREVPGIKKKLRWNIVMKKWCHGYKREI
jgi:hypothetical protein